MKHTKKILGTMLLTAAAVVATSCVDDSKLLFSVDKPASIADMEYLNAYDALKTYVNSSANPDFKLGIALAANDYIAGGLVTRLANSNFHDMTAGNAMKYASCVADDGSMNFGTVENFVSAAKAGGLTIYGHTLGWHAQQNNKYLNGLLKDKEMDVDPDEKVDVEDYAVDYSTSGYTFWNEVNAEVKETTTIGKNDAEGCLEIKTSVAAAQNHYVQYHIADNLPTVIGKEYKLRIMIKGSAAGSLNFGVGPWSGRAEGAFSFDTEWKEYDFTFTAVADGGHVMTQSGLFAGTIQIKYVKIFHSEAPTVEVEQEVNVQTYKDGPFPFYAMGCEPPVINSCLHFVPTGDWAQFFVFPGGDNPLEEGNYVIYLDLTASKDASGVQLTMQNGWGGDAQSITVAVPIKEGNHKVNLKDIDQIEFLYRFFLDKGDTIAAELLQYDTLVSYRGKVRSEAVGLPKQTKELLQVGEAFWRNEEIASTFIPNYTFKEWRKIRQQYVEMTMSRETASYLGIQHIPEGDFTVIIDVNKEVTPFIRPENIQ